MKFFLVIPAILILTSCAQPESKSQWHNFKAIHGKKYENSVEETKRFEIFKENLAEIQIHNELFSKGLKPFKMELNKFADLTKQEFHQSFTKKRPTIPTFKNQILYEKPKIVTEKSPQVDWRTKGVVTNVKDQGHCASCWSFCSLGGLEGQLALNTGKLVSLSAQNLVDCSKDYGSDGCTGGWMTEAFDYIKENGIMSEDGYPYKGAEGTCDFQPEASVTKLKGYVQLPEGDESALEEAIQEYGPVPVPIDVSNGMRFYKEGVFYDEECTSTFLIHCVLAVGFGVENGTEYYLLKNSWGEKWGEDGYIKLIRNHGNHCGVATSPIYPVL